VAHAVTWKNGLETNYQFRIDTEIVGSEHTEEEMNEDELILGDAEKAEATSVSQRKIDANRRNAKHSTGTRTVRGKRTSSFNALKHGLLSTRLMFDSEGKPEEGLHQLLEGLRDEYGHGNVRVELLLEGIVADYWRQARGLEHEINCLDKGVSAFHPQGMMPNINRYLTANRRALIKGLELLEKMRTPDQGDERTGETAGCSPSAESQAVDECGREPSQTHGSHEKSVTKINEHQQ
jgi:hypothetical protein